MNKAGYPPAVLRKEDRLAYYEALEEACVSKNFDSITGLIVEAVQRSIDAYQEVLQPAQSNPRPTGPKLRM